MITSDVSVKGYGKHPQSRLPSKGQLVPLVWTQGPKQGKVGKAMHPRLRETGCGGIVATQTGTP